MESEKNQQKCDRKWLTGGSDMEPVVKKQVKEGFVEDEVDSCAVNQSEVAVVCVEEEPCASRLPAEGLNDAKPQPCVEQNMKESSDGLTLEPCGRKKTAEDLNGDMQDSFNEELVQRSLKVTDQQICEMKQGTECLDYIGTIPIEQSVKEGSHDKELDPLSR